MISQLQYNNLYVDEVRGKWWSNLAEEDEGVWVDRGVLARTRSNLDNRNGKYRKYYRAPIGLCDHENGWTWVGISCLSMCDATNWWLMG